MKLSILHKVFRLIFYLLPVSIVVILIVVTLFFYSHSYESFIRVILDSLHRPDMESILREHYFPPEKFNRIKGWLMLNSAMSMMGLLLIYRYWKAYHRLAERVIGSCTFYLNHLKIIFISFSQRGKIALLLLLLLLLFRSLWYALTFPIQYDEAWNYNLFLDRQFYYSIGAYNNYPFHNLVSWFFVHLFGSSVWVLRLPSILIGLLSIFFVCLTAQYFLKNEKIALIIAALCCCMPVNLFYMMYARGVLFEIFFALLVCSLMLYYIKMGFTWPRIFFLSALNALGTFSMLSHPFFILGSSLALLCYAVLFEKKFIMMAIGYGLFSVSFSIPLLVPMMMGTGLSPVISVLSVHHHFTLYDLLHYTENVSFFITGFPYLFYFLFLINIGSMIHSFKKSGFLFSVCLMNSLLLLLPLGIPIITKTIPPERALSFIVVVPVCIATLLFHRMMKTTSGGRLLYPVAALSIALFSYKARTHPFLNWSKELDKQVYEVALLFKKEKIHQVYNDSRDFDYFVPGIEFYFKQGKDTIAFQSSSKQSTRYRASISDEIDAVVYSKQAQIAINVNDSLMVEIGDVLIYKRKH